MLNSLCKCLYFWADKEEEIDYSVLPKIDQADVSLDVTKTGNIFITNMIEINISIRLIFYNEILGQDVVIVKNGRRLCGTGGALANVPIIQNKAYFEVKIQANGAWGIGLATRKVDLNRLPLGADTESWVLR
jgi:hypothetical protein